MPYTGLSYAELPYTGVLYVGAAGSSSNHEPKSIGWGPESNPFGVGGALDAMDVGTVADTGAVGDADDSVVAEDADSPCWRRSPPPSSDGPVSGSVDSRVGWSLLTRLRALPTGCDPLPLHTGCVGHAPGP